jgi:acyl-CoA hydrolase
MAFGDGAGAPVELWADVRQLMADRTDASLLLAWWFTPPERVADLDPDRTQTVISGFGLRRAIDAGQVGFVPARFGVLPALLRTTLRPDVLVAAVTPVPGGFAFTTETSWQRAAIRAGARVAAVVRRDAPSCDVEEPLAAEQVVVLAEGDATPHQLVPPPPTDQQRAVAEHVAGLIPEGARVQVGPGGLGAAVYGALRVPVEVDTGLLTDPVVDLDRRGLLIGRPIAPYVAGTDLLYDWAPGRVRMCGVEITHDPARLVSGPALHAVNTGLEIDLDGQVNAEVVEGSWVGGVGGQPDYAAAAATSPAGLSIFALSSTNAGRPALVRSLSGPVTTPGHDVDVVVTERGVADLRGLTRSQRRTALARLWGSDAP